MGIVRADITNMRFSQEDRDAMARAVACYMENDKWAPKIKLPVLVLIISHPGGRCYLTECVKTHKKLGYWTAVCYDNTIDPNVPLIDYNSMMPPKDVMDQIDTFMITHYQTWGGVSYPYMWSLRLAAGLAQGFKYVYCTNGDNILEKPEGFPELLKMMGDADLMSCGPSKEREINTAAFIMKSPAFLKLATHMIDHVVPFEEYEKSTQEYGNTEGRFAAAVRELGITQKIVEPPYNEQLHIKGQGTWYKTIGLRHIHGEHNYAYRYHAIPPEYQYFDERFMGDEYKRIKEYWETKDMQIIKNWWMKE